MRTGAEKSRRIEGVGSRRNIFKLEDLLALGHFQKPVVNAFGRRAFRGSSSPLGPIRPTFKGMCIGSLLP